MTTPIAWHDDCTAPIARAVAAEVGLHVDPRRELQLPGALAASLAAPSACQRAERLAQQLAVGETYFFREAAAFHALEHEVLPALIAARQSSRRLRLWSAGCCTGEECYSLAILLCRLLPDFAEWDATVLGTDIHPGFLARAEAGVYNDWSFRGVDPTLRGQWFDPIAPDQAIVRPQLRRRVRFAHLNLAQPFDAPRHVDLVLCRHVLMYFEPEHAEQALARLHASLADDGFLLLGPAEHQPRRHSGFDEQHVGEAVLYRKRAPPELRELDGPALAGVDAAVREGVAASMRRQNDALRRCVEALAADPCNATMHCEHARILESAGELDAARGALRRALFLEPGCADAHRALGRLCERQGRRDAALRHFAHANEVSAPSARREAAR